MGFPLRSGHVMGLQLGLFFEAFPDTFSFSQLHSMTWRF